MRLRALDRQLPLAAITAFVWAGTISFFCIMFLILCLAAALTSAAKAEDTDTPANCLTDRAIFAKSMAETKHPLLLRFPDDLSRRFISAWNRSSARAQAGLSVPMSTDNITIYDFPAAMYYKVAFFKKDCLVEAIDVPAEAFWALVGAADDTKWRL